MSLYRVSDVVRKTQRIMGLSGTTDRLHWVYRCTSGGRLLTKLEILEQRSSGSADLCPCGSRTIRPTNARWWEELFLPRCWKLIYAIYAHRIAPAPEPLSKKDQAEADRTGRAASRAFERHMSQVLRSKNT
jgi:hypothetical protein